MIATASGVGLLLTVLAGIAAHVIYRTTPPGLDRATAELLAGHRVDWITTISLVLNSIGAGVIGDVVVPLVIVTGFLIARRWRSAVLFVATIAVSAGIVQLTKTVVERVRPPDGLIVIHSWSFPSGHATHAATIAVTVTLLTMRWWIGVMGAIYAMAMAFSRVYLGVHWFTDVVVGLMLGASIAGLVWVSTSRLREDDGDTRRTRLTLPERSRILTQ